MIWTLTVTLIYVWLDMGAMAIKGTLQIFLTNDLDFDSYFDLCLIRRGCNGNKRHITYLFD